MQTQRFRAPSRPPAAAGEAAAATAAAAAGQRFRSMRPPSSPSRALLVRASTKDEGPPNREDRANPNKADFSAYWSLKFREFFSQRRKYLELTRKRQEPPQVIQKLDEQIKLQEEKIEQARMAQRQARLQLMQQDPKLQEEAFQQDQQLLADLVAARAELHQPRVKLVALTAAQLRAGIRSLLLLPVTLAAAAAGRWQALFASQSYENFLMSEGQQLWGVRNRMENERWFWEMFAVDRVLVPVAWTICYQLIVPANLIWSVVVPLCLISWQTGRLPSPANLEWWLIMYVGLYLKCGDQVAAILGMLLRWW